VTDLQLKVLRILSQRGEATVVQVQHDLRPDHDLATTTVSTLLARMVKRGDVGMRRQGRQFYYCARVADADITARKLNEVAHLLFAGNAATAMAHLLDTADLTAADLRDLRKLLAEKRASGRKSKRGS
jgi:predicted transcriptional regulator